MTLRTMKACLHVFWVALAGCYAQVEDTDVAYLQSNVCGTPPTCPGNNTALNFGTVLVPPFATDLGNAGLLTSSESKQGPLTFRGGMLLNQTVVTMTTPADGNFNGLRTVDLRAAVGNDNCAQLSATCRSVGSFDSGRDGVAQQRLVLRGTNVNLLEIAGPSKRLTIYVRATGNAPTPPTWNADLELDLAISTRASFP